MEITFDPMADMGLITFGRRYTGCLKNSKGSFSLCDSSLDTKLLAAAMAKLGVEIRVDLDEEGALYGFEIFNASKLYFRDGSKGVLLRNLHTRNSTQLEFPN